MAHQGDIQTKSSQERDDFAGEHTCCKCLATINLVRAIVDSKTGRTVRMFECSDCGQRTWED
jgi:hypothetical protein